jgi:magnesium-transporting ATPase (P-type)
MFHEFWMDALEDRVVVILICAAVASLVLGVTTHDPATGWIEGFAIFVAVLIVTLVAAINDFSKDRKFRTLEAVKDDRRVKVLRNGARCEVSTYDLVVGDICYLSTGDWIPADLCVLTAHSLAVDESAMTGEPDTIKKNADTKPFCFSGTKVMEGEATSVVLAVGVSSQWGVLQMALRGKVKDESNLKWPHNKRWLICPKYPEEEDSKTPLQLKLERLANQIGMLGLTVAILLFLIQLIKWGVALATDPSLTRSRDFGSQAASDVLHFFLTAVTIIVVSIPEGLPLAVTIALAYSQRKMLKDNNLVRVLAACFDPRQPVIMANGAVRAIADVRVGDELVGDDGTARRVLGAWTGEAPMYEVAYDSETIVVTGAHQLVMFAKQSSALQFDVELGFAVPNANEMSHELLLWEPTVEQWLQFAAKFPARAQQTFMRRAKVDALPNAKLAAPTFTQLVREACDETGVSAGASAVDAAWLVGCWLADGQIATDYESSDIIGKIQRVTADLGDKLSSVTRASSSSKRKLDNDRDNDSKNAFTVLLGKLGLLGGKSMSESAQLAFVLDSPSVRGAMLAGLVDSRDGAFNGERWQITHSSKLTVDVVTRCLRSLGVHAANVGAQVEFSHHDSINAMVQTAHKRFQSATSACEHEPLYTISVRAAASVEFCGLEVDGNKRFLLGDYIVAHNCETMGGATQITTDKTGTLTQNRMTVVKGFVGGEFNADTKEFASNCQDDARRRLAENIAMNSTAFLTKTKLGHVETIGSKTECALLMLSEEMGEHYEPIREANKNNIVHLYPFASANKTSGVVLQCQSTVDNSSEKSKKSKKSKKEPVETKISNRFIYYVKGASEIVLLQCDRIESSTGSAPVPIGPKKRNELDQMIVDMASSGLRTLCLAYAELPEARAWDDETQRPEADLVLQCIVGIKDPVRGEVPAAVKDCQAAGVKVRMVTGDNVLTASHIGRECGILSDTGIAMIGPDFRKLSNAELDRLLTGERQLEVIARCSPLDKQRLVSRLQTIGEVVASTGDGTNDAPQLKMADVGFAMGIAGTEVAKEACDIILMDDNFSSVVKALMWGRNVFDAIRKFLQFQLTVNVGALLVAVIGALGVGESPLTAVQLLWINLIMDTIAALALATEQPTRALLARKPYGRFEALITTRMWRFILASSFHQVLILLVLLFVQREMYFFADVDSGRPLLQAAKTNLYPWCLDEGSLCEDLDLPRQDKTVIFNTFVLMQLFNEFNARFLNDEINIFEGLLSNHIFWIMMIIKLSLQALIVEFGWRFTQTAHLSALMWAGCVVIAFSAIPYGLLLRFVPVPDICCIRALATTAPVKTAKQTAGDEDALAEAEDEAMQDCKDEN